MSFGRLDTLTVFYGFWLPGVAITSFVIILWLMYRLLRKPGMAYNTAFIALSTLSLCFFGSLMGQGLQTLTYLHLLLFCNLSFSIASAIGFVWLTTRYDDASRPEHMRILHEEVIRPWISLFKEQSGGLALNAAQIEIEGSTIARLLLNHVFHIESGKDLDSKYFEEFIQHLKTGYRMNRKQWTNLKGEWIHHLKLAKRRIEALQKDYVERIMKETELRNSPTRMSSDSPTNLYFDSTRLVYLIYQGARSNTKQDYDDSYWQLSVIPNPGSSDIYYVSKAPFTYIAQGSRRDCERVVVAVEEFMNTPKLKAWIRKHTKTGEKLGNNLASFLDFLEELSKSVENRKTLKGRCKLCS